LKTSDLEGGRLTTINFNQAFQFAAGIRGSGLKEKANASVIRTHFLTFCRKPAHSSNALHALTIRKNIDSAKRLKMTVIRIRPVDSMNNTAWFPR
jgi:hypothetical protein